MEIIIGLVIIGVLIAALGVDIVFILQGVIIILMLVLTATLAFFVITAVTLIGSKKLTGRFLRIDKPEKGFSCAVYQTDDGEKKNNFPCEMIMKKLLYDPDHETSLLITRKGRTYDRYSIITIAAGLVLGAASVFILGGWVLTTVF